MSQGLQEITRQALQLTSAERIDLAEQLLISVAGFSSPEIEDHWRAIALQRLKELERGEVSGIPANRVFEGIEAKIHEGRISSGSK